MIKWKSSIALLIAASAAPAQPPAQQPAPPAPPSQGTPARLIGGSITNADYPAAAIQAGEQGNTRIIIDIGVDGVPTNCTVAESSGSQALDTASCTVARERFRFTPGRTADGVVSPSTYSQTVRWVLPEPDFRPFASFTDSLTATLRDGEVIACVATTDGQADEMPIETCRRLFGQWDEWESVRASLASVTHVRAFTAEGGSPPSYQPGWGEMRLSAETDLLIGPDGRVIGCEEGGRGMQRPCPNGPVGVQIFEASTDAERRGRETIGLFVVPKP